MTAVVIESPAESVTVNSTGNVTVLSPLMVPVSAPLEDSVKPLNNPVGAVHV